MFTTDLKRFIKNLAKNTRYAQIFCLLLLFALFGFSIYSHNTLMNRIAKAEKKTDFRYFNLTRTLEDIHNVKINTKDGTVIYSFTPNPPHIATNQ